MKINGRDEVVDGNIYVLSTESSRATTNMNVKLIYSGGVISVKNFHFNLKDTYFSLMGKMNFNINHALLRVNISKLAAKDLCTYVSNGIVNNEFRQ